MDASRADELAQIIDEMALERTDAWHFTRGVVSAVSSENAADIYVEGHDNLTKNVPALISYNPRVGDKVMVLRTGVGGSDMVLFGVLPSGTHKVGHWYAMSLNSPWTAYGSPYSAPYMTIDSHARVRMRGLIKDPNAPSYSPPGYPYPGNVTTLPTKFRPPEEVWLPIIGRTQGETIHQMALVIKPTGVISTPWDPDSFQEGPPVAWFSLDGVSYKAA